MHTGIYVELRRRGLPLEVVGLLAPPAPLPAVAPRAVVAAPRAISIVTVLTPHMPFPHGSMISERILLTSAISASSVPSSFPESASAMSQSFVRACSTRA